MEMEENTTRIKKHPLRQFFRGMKECSARLTAYMVEGCKGMIVLSAVISVCFATAVITLIFENFPIAVCALGAIVVVALEVCLLLLVNRLMFKSWAMGRIFFFNLLIVIAAPAVIMGPVNISAAIELSAITAFAVDIFGRCLFNTIKKKKYILGYVLLALSATWIVAAVYVLSAKGFGENLVGTYGKMAENAGYMTAPEEGFSDSILPGCYGVKSLTYGTSQDCDIVSDTVDLMTIEKPSAYYTWKLKTAFGAGFEAIPIAGKIWYPEGAKDCPTLFIVHGAHNSMVPSHLGYDYLGQYLASYGYVVVSVDENMINMTGGNNTRALLFLENIKKVFEWNDDKNSRIYSLIDEANIVIAGHSRGGETVATAYLLNNYRCYPENADIEFDYHFLIKGIIAIAPTVDQYLPADRSVAISNVNYLLIHGSHDEDVSKTEGEKQYTNVSFADGRDYFKSMVYIYGANHGQFNDMWGLYDLSVPLGYFNNVNNFIDAEDQKQILKVLTKNFMDVTLKNDDTYKSLFYDIDRYRDDLPKTAYQQTYEDSSFVSYNNFEDNTDTKTSDDSTAVLEVDNADRWKECSRPMGLDGSRENHVLEIETEEKCNCMLHIFVPDTNLTTWRFAFSIADMTEEDDIDEYFLDYAIKLRDADGHTVKEFRPKNVYPSLKVELFKTDSLSGSYIYKHQFSTVMFDCTDFEYSDEFDASRVSEITVIFRNHNRTLQIDNIGVYKQPTQEK